MKKFLPLIGVIVSIVLFSSCASVFETRNYSHLHYVKQKGNREEEMAMKNNESRGEMTPISPRTKDKISLPEQEPQLATRPMERHHSEKSAELTTNSRRNLSPESKSFNIPEIPIFKDQQRKIESATDQLFAGMDHDLRLALIFGIIGFIVLLLAALLYTPGFGEVVYTIGIILIIIGLVFLIKYLVENG